MTEFVSEVSEGGLCLCSNLWKDAKTILMIIKPHFIDIY